jgi:hypothetical protein
MRQHIDVLALLHIVWGAAAALAGLSLVILAAGTDVAVSSDGAERASAAVWLLGGAGALLLLAGAALALTGFQLRATAIRGRTLALALAAPNLLLLPFGTALGIYTYWVLLNNDARAIFGRPHRSPGV